MYDEWEETEVGPSTLFFKLNSFLDPNMTYSNINKDDEMGK